MESQDRKNLISGWPVYLLCVILLAGMAMLYRQNLSIHGNKSLPELISKNIQGNDHPFQSLDDVINDRKSWEPALPDWQAKELPNFTFVDKDQNSFWRFICDPGDNICYSLAYFFFLFDLQFACHPDAYVRHDHLLFYNGSTLYRITI